MDKPNIGTNRQGSCIAPECVNIRRSLEETRLNNDGTPDYCQPWKDFMCGKYYPHGPNRDPKKETLVTDEVAKMLYPDVLNLVESSYDVISIRPTSAESAWTNSTHNKTKYPTDPQHKSDSKGHFDISKETDADIHIWDMAGRYFNGCMGAELSYQNIGDSVLLDLMEEVNRPFAALDSMHVSSKGDRVDMYKPSMDTSKGLDAGEEKMVMGAIVNLAKYGIFPFIRYGVGVSEVSPDKVRVTIAPHTGTGLNDAWLYKFDHVKKEYSKVIEEVLLHLHGQNAAHIQKLYQLPKNIIAMEQHLHNYLPLDEEWRDMKGWVEKWSFDDLANMIPEFQLDETLQSHLNGRNVSVKSLDIMFQGTIPKYWDAIRMQSRETVRSYMLWQTFIQTAELWDMSFVQQWRDFISKYRDKVPPQPLQREACVGRVQRHFAHLLSSAMMRKDFALKNGKEGYFKVGQAKVQLGPPTGCPHAIPAKWLDKLYANAQVHSGKPDKSPPWEDHSFERVANLSRPYKWTHLHDYFALEKMHWDRTWSYLGTSTSEERCFHLGLSFKYDGER